MDGLAGGGVGLGGLRGSEHSCPGAKAVSAQEDKGDVQGAGRLRDDTQEQERVADVGVEASPLTSLALPTWESESYIPPELEGWRVEPLHCTNRETKTGRCRLRKLPDRKSVLNLSPRVREILVGFIPAPPPPACFLPNSFPLHFPPSRGSLLHTEAHSHKGHLPIADHTTGVLTNVPRQICTLVLSFLPSFHDSIFH